MASNASTLAPKHNSKHAENLQLKKKSLLWTKKIVISPESMEEAQWEVYQLQKVTEISMGH